MKVKELIEKLQKCDQEAQVYAETYCDNAIHIVGEYKLLDGDESETVVYIGDRLDAVTDDWDEDEIDYTETLYH